MRPVVPAPRAERAWQTMVAELRDVVAARGFDVTEVDDEALAAGIARLRAALTSRRAEAS